MTKASVIQQWDDSKNNALDFAIIKDTTLKSMNIRSSLSPGLAIFKKTSILVLIQKEKSIKNTTSMMVWQWLAPLEDH